MKLTAFIEAQRAKNKIPKKTFAKQIGVYPVTYYRAIKSSTGLNDNQICEALKVLGYNMCLFPSDAPDITKL